MSTSVIFRFRISPELKKRFTEVNQELQPEMSPGKRLQDLMWDFVNQKGSQSLVKLRVWRPEGYEYGAFAVEAVLTEEGKKKYERNPFPFKIPQLPKRSIHAESGYLFAELNDVEDIDVGSVEGSKRKVVLKGIFKDGYWKGHAYTNGISEEKNPTPIGEVHDALIAEMKKCLGS